MRNTLRYACILFLHVFILATTSLGQTSITSSGAIRNFDAMGSTLNLPANRKISAAGGGTTTTYAAGSAVVTQAANTCTPATGGRYIKLSFITHNSL